MGRPTLRRWLLLWALLPQLVACALDAEEAGRAAGGAIEHLAVAGSRLLASGGATLRIFDVSDPTRPREIGRLETPQFVSAAALASDGVAYAELGIRFKELERAPESLDQEWVRRGWLGIDERSYSQGEFVGVSNLAVLDLADPARPRVVGHVNLTPADTLASRLRAMTIAGKHLYASDATMGTWIFDLAEPRRPRILSNLRRGQDLAPAPSYLYLADGAAVTVTSDRGVEEFPGGLVVLDVSDPTAPKEVGRLDGTRLGKGGDGGNAERVAAGPRHVYVGVGISTRGGWAAEDYLVTVDVSDPARPREVGRLKLASSVADLTVAGKTLYVRLSGRELLIFDLADPAGPRRTRRVRLPEDVLVSLVAEPWLYLGTYDGLAVVDLRH
ncbi:MAG: LVIVD repeat-containing protein [Thermoanaerobaculia bacterium]